MASSSSSSTTSSPSRSLSSPTRQPKASNRHHNNTNNQNAVATQNGSSPIPLPSSSSSSSSSSSPQRSTTTPSSPKLPSTTSAAAAAMMSNTLNNRYASPRRPIVAVASPRAMLTAQTVSIMVSASATSTTSTSSSTTTETTTTTPSSVEDTIATLTASVARTLSSPPRVTSPMSPLPFTMSSSPTPFFSPSNPSNQNTNSSGSSKSNRRRRHNANANNNNNNNNNSNGSGPSSPIPTMSRPSATLATKLAPLASLSSLPAIAMSTSTETTPVSSTSSTVETTSSSAASTTIAATSDSHSADALLADLSLPTIANLQLSGDEPSDTSDTPTATTTSSSSRAESAPSSSIVTPPATASTIPPTTSVVVGSTGGGGSKEAVVVQPVAVAQRASPLSSSNTNIPSNNTTAFGSTESNKSVPTLSSPSSPSSSSTTTDACTRTFFLSFRGQVKKVIGSTSSASSVISLFRSKFGDSEHVRSGSSDDFIFMVEDREYKVKHEVDDFAKQVYDGAVLEVKRMEHDEGLLQQELDFVKNKLRDLQTSVTSYSANGNSRNGATGGNNNNGTSTGAKKRRLPSSSAPAKKFAGIAVAQNDDDDEGEGDWSSGSTEDMMMHHHHTSLQHRPQRAGRSMWSRSHSSGAVTNNASSWNTAFGPTSASSLSTNVHRRSTEVPRHRRSSRSSGSHNSDDRNNDSSLSMESSTTVRIRGLPWHATNKDVEQFFSGLHIAESGIYTVLDDDGKHNGDAYVTFVSEEDAELARERSRGSGGHPHQQQRRIDVRMVSRGEMYHIRGKTVPLPESSPIVRLRGMPIGITASQIRDFLNGISIVEDGIHLFYLADGNTSGEAMVYLRTLNDVIGARARHHHHINGRPVEVVAATMRDWERVRSWGRHGDKDHHHNHPSHHNRASSSGNGRSNRGPPTSSSRNSRPPSTGDLPGGSGAVVVSPTPAAVVRPVPLGAWESTNVKVEWISPTPIMTNSSSSGGHHSGHNPNIGMHTPPPLSPFSTTSSTWSSSSTPADTSSWVHSAWPTTTTSTSSSSSSSFIAPSMIRHASDPVIGPIGSKRSRGGTFPPSLSVAPEWEWREPSTNDDPSSAGGGGGGGGSGTGMWTKSPSYDDVPLSSFVPPSLVDSNRPPPPSSQTTMDPSPTMLMPLSISLVEPLSSSSPSALLERSASRDNLIIPSSSSSSSYLHQRRGSLRRGSDPALYLSVAPLSLLSTSSPPSPAGAMSPATSPRNSINGGPVLSLSTLTVTNGGNSTGPANVSSAIPPLPPASAVGAASLTIPSTTTESVVQVTTLPPPPAPISTPTPTPTGPPSSLLPVALAAMNSMILPSPPALPLPLVSSSSSSALSSTVPTISTPTTTATAVPTAASYVVKMRGLPYSAKDADIGAFFAGLPISMSSLSPHLPVFLLCL
jgi:hypothetical protein